MRERRTIQELRQHYEVEKELASRLRHASRQERRDLYSSVYDELYRRVPDHPQLMQRRSPQDTMAAASAQMKILKPFLNKDVTFLEVGSGDCALSLEVAKHVRLVYAIDVSQEITSSLTRPGNFHLVVSDGMSIPVPRDSVHVAYTHHLLEHLPPDDAHDHLENIWNALVPGGLYICITPNRLSGLHDISGYFDAEATGFHLKEYSTLELRDLFSKTRYVRHRVYIGARGRYMPIPPSPIIMLERLFGKLPHELRRAVTAHVPFRALLGSVRFVGAK